MAFAGRAASATVAASKVLWDPPLHRQELWRVFLQGWEITNARRLVDSVSNFRDPVVSGECFAFLFIPPDPDGTP